jgi:WD40 repeat protein
LWDVASGQKVRTLRHSGNVNSVTFAPDGRTLASGSDDKTIKLWDVASGREVRTLSGHTASVWSVAFAPDGRTLASGSYDGTVQLWGIR